jgi:hypothetical protein
MVELTFVKRPEEEYELPSYRDPGRILVHYMGIGTSVYRHETETLDHDGDSSVYWLNEGIGFEYFYDAVVDFYVPAFIPPNEADAYFVIEGITGSYTRGEWGFTDDDEEWEYTNIRPATAKEIETMELDDLQPVSQTAPDEKQI